MNMYDLNKPQESEDGKVKPAKKGPVINIDTEQVPEIDDFNVHGTVEMKVIARVLEVRVPDSVVDGNIVVKDQTKSYVLEIVEAGVLNPSKDRAEAERRGLDKKDWQEIKSRRSMSSS